MRKNCFIILLGILFSLTACNSDDDQIGPGEIVSVGMMYLDGNPANAKEGDRIEALYTVSRFTSDDYITDKGVSIKWYKATDPNDPKTFTIIAGATQKKYRITKEDLGKSIRPEFTIVGTTNKKKTSDFWFFLGSN